MSRTSRLLQLLDALRGRRRPVTAADLAEQLSVSLRTIYRDVLTLSGLGAPIEGSAGVGYLLRPGYFLPPLMFDVEELEALVLGARWLQGQGDPELARAAESALAKIATASPRDLRDQIADTGLWAPRFGPGTAPESGLRTLREAIRRERKVRIDYTDLAGSCSERMVWPIALAFFEGKRLLVAWCEARRDFRHFRTDRITRLVISGQSYPQRRQELVTRWRRQQQDRRQQEPRSMAPRQDC